MGSTSMVEPSTSGFASTGTSNEMEASAGSTSPADGSTTDAETSAGSSTGAPQPDYPEPGDWPPQTGPGGPAVAFDEAALFQNCAFLDGGPLDADHHNLVVMFDGYLMLPWAPEWGAGGISFFDVSDPCNPSPVGTTTTSGDMRETHAVGFAEIAGRWYTATAHVEAGLLNTGGGVMFWDVTNPAQPLVISTLELPGHLYPDAYARVIQSAFWQGYYLYVGGSDNGLYIVDASDPFNPSLVAQEAFEPTLRVGQVQVVGNLLMATAAE